MELPDAPALVCDSGVVIDANTAAARLAGRRIGSLVGLPADRLLVGADSDAELLGPDGRAVPVRVVRWTLPGSDLLVLLLVDVSDLRSAGDALRTERRRLTEVERVAEIGSWEYDPFSGETQWSPGHYEILGVGRDIGLVGADTVLDVVHPDDHGRVAAYWRECVKTGAAVDIEYRVVRPDGEVRTISARAQPQRDGRGRLLRYTGSIRDVTEARRVQGELATERARLLEAQRIARTGSFTRDPVTGAMTYSDALVEIFDARSVDPAANPLEMAHPEDRKLLLELEQQVLADAGGTTHEVEFRGLPGDGDPCYVCRARAERAESGEALRIVGTVQDVTEARAMERELREERRRLAEAQRVASIGAWEWDPAAGEVRWSPMLRELYGVPVSTAATYESYLSLVHPEDRGWADELWRALAVDHRPVECEHRVIRPDAAVRTFRCYGAMMLDPAGGPRLVGTAQDVTEQRAAETRMERSSQRFADLVAIMPVGIGIFDDADRLVDANDALCGLLGHDLERLRGMTAAELTHPVERGRLDTLHGYGGPGAKSFSVPQRMFARADGEPVYCELHVSVSVQDDGQRFLLVVFADVTERRQVAEALKHQATHDELTGLPNRAAVSERLTELLAEPEGELAVLFCDIDNFKRVNDSLGHDAGDELLLALARRLEDGLPDRCTAARLSGDVYVVICSDATAHGGVQALVATVGSLLRTAVPVQGQLVRVSAAIGVAVPDGSTSGPEDLLRFADAAMFQAKCQGAGRAALASAALMASADRQVALEGQLREALAGDELSLHYQPVVSADGTVLTAEALIRWQHPERGMLSPEVFLPVAEQGDLMRELDRWVLRAALAEARGWPSYNGRQAAVAVNLAGLTPGDPDFVDTVATLVAESGIPWDRVVLELVETSLVDLPSRTRHAMAELVERGVRFAVDDFGTGYSSLARIKELPAQIVKVDRRFVSGVGVDPSDFAVARAVVDMARAMGRCCVAEGVETATQFHVLRGLGVEAYQGWLFSRPVPPREFRTVLSLGPLHVPTAREWPC
ncbi:MAG: EAL domain-containing protein [Pseudonocardiaceae bacterium]|nr:EAL domain-containing protein [Pseudonocardiaceae bacterium]